jgi:K+-transporting ATPase c subunit
MKIKVTISAFILSAFSTGAFAYPECPTEISGASGPCGANGELTIESSGSITGSTIGNDGTNTDTLH